ncbi:MAG: NUDIX domain-containing protein [Candidatus Aenigmarchaeota archaeon]|nr:NUDIX domain-containing protein [Candidatus Aenigmarchaeota archaeon]
MTERKVIVVDEKDSPIGTKRWQELSAKDIYRASALWITNSNGDILLARRAFTKKHDPGKWGPAVAGTVEEGETYESNIIKEAEEELGLKNINPATGPNERTFGSTYTHFTQWFTLVVPSSQEFVVQKEEVAEIRWFSKKELLQAIEEETHEFIPNMKRWADSFCK